MSPLLLASLWIALGSPGPDTAVVCPQEFLAALAPWIEYRRSQGHDVALISNLPSPDEIRQEIRQRAREGGLHFLVLVGDAEPVAAAEPAHRARRVPVSYRPATVIVRWGSEPHIPDDGWYGDLDGDQVPDLAVGRLPVDSASQLALLVEKILAYEQSTDFGQWRRQINIVAGTGGFGPLIDTIIESAARHLITQDIPPAYHTTMTYAGWRSPYCPGATRFAEATRERLNEGSLFWAYLGHGLPTELASVEVSGQWYPVLNTADTSLLHARHGFPIALLFACYAGAIDARDPCLAEQMVLTPGGPVAAIAGSRVTMPYGMTLLARELIRECFERRRPTLGQALLEAKRALARPPAGGQWERVVLDALAGAVSPAGNSLDDERREHAALFQLLGDPLLRIRYPDTITLVSDSAAEPGSTIRVAGVSPIAGRAVLELCPPLGSLTFPAPTRTQCPRSPEEWTTVQAVYERVIHSQWAASEADLPAGEFNLTLTIPPEAGGRCNLRLYVAGETGFALGANAIDVRRPQAAGDGQSRQ